jgi:hypothetical protein
MLTLEETHVTVRKSRRIILVRGLTPGSGSKSDVLMQQRHSRRRRGRGERVLGLPRHNLNPSRHLRRMRNREANLFRESQRHRSKVVSLLDPAVTITSGTAISWSGNSQNTSRRWVPFCGLVPVVRFDRISGPSTRVAPWSLRSATDRRIVPSSRSPNLGWIPIRGSEPNVLAWSPAFGHSPPPRGSRFGSPVVLTGSIGCGPKWSSRSAMSNGLRTVLLPTCCLSGRARRGS